jgi:hypothetical protein
LTNPLPRFEITSEGAEINLSGARRRWQRDNQKGYKQQSEPPKTISSRSGDRTEHSLGVRLTVNTSSRNSEEGGLSWLGRQGKMSEVQLDFQEVRREC